MRKDRCISSLQGLLDWLQTETNHSGTAWYLNPYTLSLAKSGEIPICEKDYYVCDGGLMASALSKSLGVRCESLHFDFSGCADEVFRASSSNKLSVAIIGGNDEHLNRFVSLLHSRYPKLRIVFSHNGYFDFSGSSSIFTKLEQSKPDLILVSMGSPRQEKFCAEVKKRTLGHPKLITCGAFVSQTALAGDNYYPDIIVKLRIRWLYRLTKDHRIFPRILKYYFPFIIREYITGKNELFK